MKVARWQARSRMIDWPNYFFGVWAPVADLYSDFNTNPFWPNVQFWIGFLGISAFIYVY